MLNPESRNPESRIQKSRISPPLTVASIDSTTIGSATIDIATIGSATIDSATIDTAGLQSTSLDCRVTGDPNFTPRRRFSTFARRIMLFRFFFLKSSLVCSQNVTFIHLQGYLNNFCSTSLLKTPCWSRKFTGLQQKRYFLFSKFTPEC